MREHDLSGGCWCDPSVEVGSTNPHDDDGATFTTHKDEAGVPIFYTINDDTVPLCVDCDEVLEAYMPDPDWLIRDGQVFWSVTRSDHFGIGIAVHNHEFSFGLVFSLGWWGVMLRFTSRTPRRAVSDQVEELAPSMISEIEQHLRSHG